MSIAPPLCETNADALTRLPRKIGRTTWGAVCRKILWRCVFALTGGIRVTGDVPAGAFVAIANHSSHADTAALLAALPARRRPVVAAAVDYWFASWRRRAIVGSLVSALPVDRGQRGAFAALQSAATPVLASGGIVMLFPEGTRSTDGTVGDFRSGAVRLARAAQVPIVPITLVGTGRLLPKHGRLSLHAIEVRVGAALLPSELETVSDDEACSALRCEIVANAFPDAVEPLTSRVWRRVAARANSASLLAVSFTWGVAEAISWPVLAEMFMVLWVAGTPRRIMKAATGLWLGSVIGVVVHAMLSRHGVGVPMPLTTPRMQATAARDLASGASGLMHQALAGIPVKVYAAQAGKAHIGLLALAFWTAIERGVRIMAVAVGLYVVTKLVHPVLRRFYGVYLLLAASTFAVLLHEIVASWK
jgi:1-acyl-sn-glycerol-3-phosphate acyltransferase